MKISKLTTGFQSNRKLLNLSKHTKRIKSKAISLLRRNIFFSKNEAKLRDMIKSGEIAIIPSGFRCYTKAEIFKNLNFTQPSLPFDSGFFPPYSIASVIKNPTIHLKYNDNNLTHCVCIKHEKYSDPVLGYGIKFQRSSYEEINSFTMNRDIPGINKYLDNTFGYYTLDVKHSYVLAHYNWHRFSSRSKIHDPSINLEEINKILNRRIQRMFELCNSARYVFFVTGENQGYQYMMIENQYFNLHSFNEIVDAVESSFNAKCFVVTIGDLDNVDKLFAMIN